MKYEIEKNIAPPVGRRGQKTQYPFGDMAVGDSFFVPKEDDPENKVRFAASYFGIRHPGFRFSVRKVEGGVRVWRVEANDGNQPTP